MLQQGTATLMTLDHWQQWESRVVGGRYALSSYLGGSNRSAVYFTDFDGNRAVIKLVPADTAGAQAQLSRWEAACNIAHPNLLRVFETGRWHADEERDMFFAVMEYADENLAEVLRERSLTAEEVREMLVPMLDALQYLHGQNLVHGDLKASNVLAAGHNLKLALDGVRRSGTRVSEIEQDWRAAPEVLSSNVLARNDIWALGVLLVESLTGKVPELPNSEQGELKLPDSVPEPFASIAHECLRRDPAKRCSIGEIRKMLDRPVETKKPGMQVASLQPAQTTAVATEIKVLQQRPKIDAEDDTQPIVNQLAATPSVGASVGASTPATLTGKLPGAGSMDDALALPSRGFLPFAVVVLASIAAIVGLVRFFSSRSENAGSSPAVHQEGLSSSPIQQASAPAARQAPKPCSGGVVHKVIPTVLRSAQDSIHGIVKVRVQVNVDESGSVTLAGLTVHGPSRYFARQSLEAARQWTFTPPIVDGKPIASRWAIEFDFRRSGVKTEPSMIAPRV